MTVEEKLEINQTLVDAIKAISDSMTIISHALDEAISVASKINEDVRERQNVSAEEKQQNAR